MAIYAVNLKAPGLRALQNFLTSLSNVWPLKWRLRLEFQALFCRFVLLRMRYSAIKTGGKQAWPIFACTGKFLALNVKNHKCKGATPFSRILTLHCKALAVAAAAEEAAAAAFLAEAAALQKAEERMAAFLHLLPVSLTSACPSFP